MKRLFFFILIIFLFSCKKENKILHNNYNYQKARVFREANEKDSAFYYYNLAKNDFLKTSDSLGIGNSLVNMAVIQTGKGDFFGGIESSLEANKFLKKQNDSAYRRALSTNYNNIGLAYHFLKEFERSSSNYITALEYIDNEEDKYLCYNNIGDLLISQKKYDSAKAYLNKALATTDSATFSKVINNLAKAKYLKDKNYNPLPELFQALHIRERSDDALGRNSSFETLSTYYLDKDNNVSLFFAKCMLQSALENKLPDDQITALKRIVTLDSDHYLQNFKKLDSINDHLQTTISRHKNQFASVRYDVEQKNALNQKLKVDNFKKNIGLLSLGLLLIVGTFYFKKRKKRLEQEKELEVKNTQLRLSKKVHDVVANGIYQVMTKIENQEEFDRNKALDELEFVYEKSRDISYDKAGEEKEFSKEISELIASFNNATVKTFTAGNNPAIWENLSPAIKEEVYQIIRELMVNMKKHSRASHVAFKFERTDKEVEIQYKDNGIGISGEPVFQNGLQNTTSRIEAISGTIIFDTKIEKGLKVNLSFPVS